MEESAAEQLKKEACVKMLSTGQQPCQPCQLLGEAHSSIRMFLALRTWMRPFVLVSSGSPRGTGCLHPRPPAKVNKSSQLRDPW